IAEQLFRPNLRADRGCERTGNLLGQGQPQHAGGEIDVLGAKRAGVHPGNISRSATGVDKPLGGIEGAAGKSVAECGPGPGRIGWPAGLASNNRVYACQERKKKESASQHEWAQKLV